MSYPNFQNISHVSFAGDFIRDLVALPSGGSGGVVWRIRANHTKLICAVGSRNGTEETKLLVLDFDAQAPTQQQRQQHHHQQFIQQIHSNVSTSTGLSHMV